jgi:hypothetical protein|tara:strand:+ start:618 stop:941 length:324 start_codon:yes stop_codon:yes gene_type:complete
VPRASTSRYPTQSHREHVKLFVTGQVCEPFFQSLASTRFANQIARRGGTKNPFRELEVELAVPENYGQFLEGRGIQKRFEGGTPQSGFDSSGFGRRFGCWFGRVQNP